MINDLIDEIKLQFKKNKRVLLDYNLKRILISLLALKYCCDKFNLSYGDLIKAEKLDDICFPSEFNKYKTLCTIDSINLLTHIQYEKIEDLVKEFLDDSDIGIKIFNKGEKIICVQDYSRAVRSDINFGMYDINGNTTYILDKFSGSMYVYSVFKFFDEVLGVSNKYLEYNEVSFEDYDYLYIYDGNPIFKFAKNSDNFELIDFIFNLLKRNKDLKIILNTKFKKISNVRNVSFIIGYISKILFYDEKNTFISFEKKDDELISIVDYNRDKVKSLDKLFEIIKNNRKMKDVLVKTTVTDISENRYRIGFKLYQDGIEQNIKSINQIVDENTMLINRLSRINDNISQEIDKIINR